MTEGDDGRSAVRLIAINPTLRAEAERLLPILTRASQPAADEEVLAILVKHAPAYGVHAKSDGEWAALFGSYLEALEGLPAYAVEEGFVRWNRGEGHKDLAMSGFYPRPPQLYQLVQLSRNELGMAKYRAQKALEFVEDRGLEWTPERKAAERQKMIDAGYLNPDGTPNMTGLGPRTMPQDRKPSRSPQEVAEELRRSDAQARHGARGGAPISRRHTEPADPGDVI